MKLAGKKPPDSRVASLMVQAYAGLGQLEKATAAQEIVARDRNSAGAYATLATLAYQANNMRLGDLAKDKALELTEPDMRESLQRPARIGPRAGGAGLRPDGADADADSGGEVAERLQSDAAPL